jgi:outer membrane protein TolC
MRRLRNAVVRIGNPAVILLAAFLVPASSAFAQIGSVGSQPQSTQAAQLPLSGRTGQTGGVAATETPVPGTTASVNTLNPTIQVQGPYTGSVSSTTKIPFSGKLSLREAVQRALAYNLGAVGLAQAIRQAHGLSRVARSALLPNVNGDIAETAESVNLQAIGIHFSVPGFSIPAVVGPFNYMDVRARLSQTVANLTALNNYRSAKEIWRANEFSAQDARDLVVLAVGGAYLQAIAAQARVEAARAQVETANALYKQTMQQFNFGKVPQLDVNRSQVEALTQQQRLLSLQADAAKQKINLARLTGLSVNDEYELTDQIPFTPAPSVGVEDALKQAVEQRADLQSAAAQVRAAERTLTAARDERLPSLSLSADYGAIGTNPGQAHGTFTAVATLSVPIWQGGRAQGDIEQASAALSQRQAELEDLKGEIESEVRNAYLDLQAAVSQVELARQNLQLSQETLNQMRIRLEAGVANNVELVQAQESVASAQLDYINSVFAHNIAKLSLARAIGNAPDSLPKFLSLP